ncbi:MAG: APC family permease [Pseudomonadales bacterium]
MLLLYGIGTTIGAGIYALLGEIAAVAGPNAPWSFLLASLIAGLTAFSFAELSSRYPQAGATAKYVQMGLGSPRLAFTVGILVALAGVVSSAALLNGMANYVQGLLDADRQLLIAATVVLLCLLTCWGIKQSVLVAGVISVAEVCGLLWISWICYDSIDYNRLTWHGGLPDFAALPSITFAAVLAFYAYIGFEDMVEVAEEVRNVKTVLPRAIILTLVISTVLYLVLVIGAQLAVTSATLATMEAPMADLYATLTQRNPLPMTLISAIAIVNGILIQMVMSSRVLYGLASRGQLPSLLGKVSRDSRTPVNATLLVALCIGALALNGSLARLAEVTAIVMLIVFALANLSLLRIHQREAKGDHQQRTVPTWIPWLGLFTCVAAALNQLTRMV